MTGDLTDRQPPDSTRNSSFRPKQADAFSFIPLLRKVGLRREKSLFASAGFIPGLFLRPFRLNLLLCSLLFLFAFSRSAQAPIAVPIPKEPHHHLVLENDYVRVFRVSVPAHESTLLHQHDVPYLYVSLGSADVINAVQDKPEAHLIMADGQLGYSPGHFAHIARNLSDAPFSNVTIELLKPQGEPRNLCDKVVPGPVKECSSDSSKLPANSPLIALARAMRQIGQLETDEIVVTSFSIALKMNYNEPDSQSSRLLVVDDNSELQVEIPGETSKALHAGEVLWLEAGKKWTIDTPGPHKLTRFLLIRFKDGEAAKWPW